LTVYRSIWKLESNLKGLDSLQLALEKDSFKKFNALEKGSVKKFNALEKGIVKEFNALEKGSVSKFTTL